MHNLFNVTRGLSNIRLRLGWVQKKQSLIRKFLRNEPELELQLFFHMSLNSLNPLDEIQIPITRVDSIRLFRTLSKQLPWETKQRKKNKCMVILPNDLHGRPTVAEIMVSRITQYEPPDQLIRWTVCIFETDTWALVKNPITVILRVPEILKLRAILHSISQL